MHFLKHKFLKHTFYLVGLPLAFLSLNLRAELVLNEHFDAYEAGSELTGQGSWQSSPYGQHPANFVMEDATDLGRGRYVKAPGGADHYGMLKLSAATSNALAEARVVWLSAVHRGNVALYLDPIRINFGAGPTVSVAGTTLSGMRAQVKGDAWIESLLILERGEDGLYKLSLGSRPAGNDTLYVMDPLVASSDPIGGDKLGLVRIQSLLLRLDGVNAVDDIRMGVADSLTSLPFKMSKVAKVDIAYNPILEYLLPPRNAKDLGGVWKMAATKTAQEPMPETGWNSVVVPGKHDMLFSHGNKVVWFKRQFTLPDKQAGKTYELCFERVTDQCEVFVNGRRAGEGKDGFFPFRIDVTDQIKAGGNTIAVKVYGPTQETVTGKRPIGLGWLYSHYAGIPYPVHLEESSDELSIQDVYVTAKVDPVKVLQAEVVVTNRSNRVIKGQIVAKVSSGEFAFNAQEVHLEPQQTKIIKFSKEWVNPRLWWPHDPHLYFLDVALDANGKTVDAYRQRFGFREMNVKGPSFFLNGEKIMQRRDSMLVYWGSEEGHRKELPLFRSRGFNGLRLHLNPSWRMVRICDEEGFLVSPEGAICQPHGDQVQDEFWPAARQHLLNMVKLMRSSPSVMYWSLSNEFASYYMKGSSEIKAEVDTRMVSIGNEMTLMDPTRIWTSSGDGELGGVGRHGPAPSLSLHYAWQPVKQHNTLPRTAGWLEENQSPWQGIVWDRNKPLMLSEDMYPAYSLNIPDGMTAWAGDKAYDLNGGVYEAWHAVFDMLAPSYYRVGVSVWNPWATAAGAPENRLYDLGPLMPDFLIAPDKLSNNFRSGSAEDRHFTIYNQTMQKSGGYLEWRVTDEDGQLLAENKDDIEITAGEKYAFSIRFTAPVVKTRKKLNLSIAFCDTRSGAVYASKEISYNIYPLGTPTAPANCALVAKDESVLKGVAFSAGRFGQIDEALKGHPSSLVIAKAKLTPRDTELLQQAVSNGLKVLLIETEASGHTPARIDQRKLSSYAFIRDENDPAVIGLDESDIRLWSEDMVVSREDFLKSVELNSDIILDTGGSNGLLHSPLMRVYTGHGYYLLCQLGLVSLFEQEPAASYVLQRLFNSMEKVVSSPSRPVAVPVGDKQLKAALETAGVQYNQLTPENDQSVSTVLIMDAQSELADSDWAWIRSRAEVGLDTMLHNVSEKNVAALADKLHLGVVWQPAFSRQLLRQSGTPLTAGLSNSDLCWYEGNTFYQKVNAQMVGRDVQETGESMISGSLRTDNANAEQPFAPLALLRLPLGSGRVILSTLRWDQFLNTQTVKSKMLIHRLLRNLGCLTVAGSDKLKLYQPVDIRSVANRAFWSQSQPDVTAWFGETNDDLRYFPVNVTGFDPNLRMDQPKEPFPSGVLNYAGIDFSVINPDQNRGRSCLVVATGSSSSIKIGEKGDAIWMLGALRQHHVKGAEVVRIVWDYKDSGSVSIVLRAGEQLNGYQYMTPITDGICAWTGPTPIRTDAVLWAWRIPNPKPDQMVAGIKIVAEKESLGLISMSLEK